MPSYHLTAELKNLAPLRNFVEQTAVSLQAGPHVVIDLVQAVDEAATNIIVHGYQGQPGDIEVNIDRQGDRLVICMRDKAPAFDPTFHPDPDLGLPLDKRPVGGLGIYLIRKSVDEIHYRPLPAGGNELILIKHSATTA